MFNNLDLNILKSQQISSVGGGRGIPYSCFREEAHGRRLLTWESAMVPRRALRRYRTARSFSGILSPVVKPLCVHKVLQIEPRKVWEYRPQAAESAPLGVQGSAGSWFSLFPGPVGVLFPQSQADSAASGSISESTAIKLQVHF